LIVAYDIEQVRSAYPALTDGYAYLDGAAGTQVPAAVIDAIAAAYREGLGNLGGAFPASARSGEIVAACRTALAALTGGDPDGVILGPNMTTLTYRLAGTLAKRWQPGDEIVVSELDHDANVRPWVQTADRAGVTVRWAEVDKSTGELPAEQYRWLISDRTRLVAVTAASNAIGTRPDVPAIAGLAHQAGALVYVDGVHATPHMPVDVGRLGADFYATSAYKWSGPHIGAVVGIPEVLEPLRPDKLNPAPDTIPDRFERGTLPFADLAGVTAAVEHLASLDPSATGTLRERVLTSMNAVEQRELNMFKILLGGLAEMDHVTLHGSAARRAPTVYFSVAGHRPADVAAHLASRRINVWAGTNYAVELCRALGLGNEGAVRAGIVHYNDASDVDRFLAGVADLAS
jgi:cysteine desulfurase family protein (TIGR01976 family)